MTGTTAASPELLTPAAAWRWTPAVFGVVPEGARRRRPGDVGRIAVAALIVMLTAFGADELAPVEKRLFDLFTSMPGWVRSGAEFGCRMGAVGTVVAVLLAFVLTRRLRLVSMLVLAGAVAGLAAIGLRALVDTAFVRTAGGLEVDGSVPEYPVVVLAVATTVLLVAAPYLLRPARRLVFAVLAVAAVSAVCAVVGLPDDVLGGWALGWGVAALVHLVVGTPAATPSIGEVDDALRGLGVAVTGLRLAPVQVWGETRFSARDPRPRMRRAGRRPSPSGAGRALGGEPARAPIRVWWAVCWRLGRSPGLSRGEDPGPLAVIGVLPSPEGDGGPHRASVPCCLAIGQPLGLHPGPPAPVTRWRRPRRSVSVAPSANRLLHPVGVNGPQITRDG